jgi:NAD/NADP transhydrogenase alpha subunit
MNISKYTGLSAFSAGSFASFFQFNPPTTADGCATPAITPTSFPAMIFAAAQTSAAFVLTPGTGFTSRFAGSGAGDGGNGVYAEDLRLTSGSNIASFTAGTTNNDVTVIGAAYIETAPAVSQVSSLSFMSMGPG